MLDGPDPHFHDAEIAAVAADTLLAGPIGDVEPERAGGAPPHRPAELQITPLAAMPEPVDLLAVREERITPAERAGADGKRPGVFQREVEAIEREELLVVIAQVRALASR